MSTTPVLTALPASNVGNSLRPADEVDLQRSLALGVELLQPLLQVDDVDAVLGEGADEPERRLLCRARPGRRRPARGAARAGPASLLIACMGNAPVEVKGRRC